MINTPGTHFVSDQAVWRQDGTPATFLRGTRLNLPGVRSQRPLTSPASEVNPLQIARDWYLLDKATGNLPVAESSSLEVQQTTVAPLDIFMKFDQALQQGQSVDGFANGSLAILWSAPRRAINASTLPKTLSLTYEMTNNGGVIVCELIGQYVKNSWHDIGEMVLGLFMKALDHIRVDRLVPFSEIHELSSHTDGILGRLRFAATRDVLSVSGTCSLEQWTKVRETLIWLEQAIGCPSHGLYIRPFVAELRTHSTIRAISDIEQKLQSFDVPGRLGQLESGEDVFYLPRLIFDFQDERPVNLQEKLYALCWSQLFTSAYIAERPHHTFDHTGVGLRIQFELLLELAAIERAITYDNGVILTGYDAALIPTGRTESSIQWHLVVQNLTPGRKRSWLDSNHVPIYDIETRLKELSLDSLKMTAYVGWAETIAVILGTQPICQSPRTTHLSSVTDQLYIKTGYSRAGTFGLGLSSGPFTDAHLNFAGNLSVMTTEIFTITGPRITRSRQVNFERRFWDLYRQVVVIYDVDNERGWLVPKINVVLLLVRMYMKDANLSDPLPIPYPQIRNEDRYALDHKAWNIIRELEKRSIECDENVKTSIEKFGDLFKGFADDLDAQLEHLEARHTTDIFGVELLDIYRGKFGFLKKLSREDKIKNWSPLVNGMGLIVCHGLDPALKVISEEIEGNSDLYLSRSYSLCCTVGDLILLLEDQGCSDWEGYRRNGYIEKRGEWRWVLENNPFNHMCEMNTLCNMECWQKRIQRIEKWDTTIPTRSMTCRVILDSMNAGLCFGDLRREAEIP